MKWLIFYVCELQNSIIIFCSISLFSKVEDDVFREFCEEIGIENIRVYEQEHVRQQEEIDKRRWYMALKCKPVVGFRLGTVELEKLPHGKQHKVLGGCRRFSITVRIR